MLADFPRFRRMPRGEILRGTQAPFRAAWLTLAFLSAMASVTVKLPAQSQPASGFQPVVSPDGRKLAYADTVNGFLNLFLLDLTTGVFQRLSALPGNAAAPSNHSYGARFLGTNSALVFESLAQGLVAADDNRQSDIYVYSWERNGLECISLLSTGLAGSGSARDVVSSLDGQWIAFGSDSSGLMPFGRDASTLPKVYLFNIGNQTRVFASSNRLGRPPASPAVVGGLSADGSRLLFRCGTNDITRVATTGVTTPWFWRDNASGLNSMVRLRTNGTLAALPFECHALSGDGRFVAGSLLSATAGSGFNPGLYRVSLDGHAAVAGPGFGTGAGLPNTVPRFTTIFDVQINHDGSRILIAGFLRTNAVAGVRRGALLWEPDDSRMTPLLPSQDPTGTGAIHSATLSPSGDRIAFVDPATGLWVLDRAFQVLFGPAAVGDFPAPAFSANGRWLTFQSSSSAAAPGARGHALFLVDLDSPAVPSLTIQRDGAGFVILWDPRVTGVDLEFADSLSGGGWERLSPVQAGRHEVEAVGVPLRVFRLTKKGVSPHF